MNSPYPIAEQRETPGVLVSVHEADTFNTTLS
jgi:hypothetical protein